MSASTKRFKCKVCKEAFEFPYRLKLHSVVHSGERPYECETCGSTFKRTYNLYEHMRIHKKNTGKKKSKTTPVMENDEVEEELDPVPEPKRQLQNIDSKKRKSTCEVPSAKKVKIEDHTRRLRSQRNKNVNLDDSQSSSAQQEPIEYKNQSDETPEPTPLENQNQSQSTIQPIQKAVSKFQDAVGNLEKLGKAMDKLVEKKNASVMDNNEAEKEVKEEMDPVPEPKPQFQNMYSNYRKTASDLDKTFARNVKTEDHTQKLRSQSNKRVDDSQSSSVFMRHGHTVMKNNEAEKEVKEEMDAVPEPKPQLQKIDSNKRKLASESEKPSAKKVKTEDTSQSHSTLIKAVKQETIEFENQLEPVQEAPESMPVQPIHKEVSTSESVTGNQEPMSPPQVPQPESLVALQVANAQNPIGVSLTQSAPVVQQQTPPNFEEDSRQISHQIMRVAANSTKDRQDCFRQLMFATVFAFESSPTCTNVEEFFRMMGERYSKK